MEENEKGVLTEKDFKEFLTATGEAQFRILLAHAERNKKITQSKKLNAEIDATDKKED